VIAPWIPVTVVPTSFATVAIETFITELSSVIRNCPAASVIRTSVAPLARAGIAAASLVMGRFSPGAVGPGERAARAWDPAHPTHAPTAPPQMPRICFFFASNSSSLITPCDFSGASCWSSAA
jgi:hypothetical protein